MVGLAVVFLVVLLLPLSASLTATERTTLWGASVVISVLFGIEYAIRLYLTEERLSWFKSHILDLLVVAVPFLRPFRLIRVAAILLSASKRAGAAAVRQVLLYVAVLAAIVMCVGAVIVYHYERNIRGSGIHSLGAAFWWAFTTVSTVGTNTASPVTTVGRVVGVVLIFTGLAVVGCITAAVAAAFVNAVRGKPAHDQIAETHANQQELSEKIDLLSETITKLHEDLTAVRRHLGESRANGSQASGAEEVARANEG